ncbi:kinetochore Sim4 complex subunit Fta4 [Xylariales sp. PMI_506]|nr:kinetochore Sim4 complex subunit Fta4 [Xylariales sp. PMI_506]
MAPPTILAHKSAFLSAQTLHLSQALAPSPAWRAANDHRSGGSRNDEDGAAAAAAAASIPERALEDALFRLNHALQQHVRRVYPAQATRHIAEQIDSLFLDAGGAADRGAADGGDGDGDGDPDSAASPLREGTDLTTDAAISSLPPTWDVDGPESGSAATDPSSPEARRYAELYSSLTSLAARRTAARARVDRLRHMQSLLKPLAATGSEEDGEEESGEGSEAQSLQSNLVTRNGDVEKELERMRMLLVRVAGRVAQLPKDIFEDDEAMPDLDELERTKVQNILNRF